MQFFISFHSVRLVLKNNEPFETYRSLNIQNGQHFETVKNISFINELDRDFALKNQGAIYGHTHTQKRNVCPLSPSKKISHAYRM